MVWWGYESSHRRSWKVVWTDHDAAVAAQYRADSQRWRVLFDDLMCRSGSVIAGPSRAIMCVTSFEGCSRR